MATELYATSTMKSNSSCRWHVVLMTVMQLNTKGQSLVEEMKEPPAMKAM